LSFLTVNARLFESREALYLVNHSIDEAVRGVQRLKKSPKLSRETYHKPWLVSNAVGPSSTYNSCLNAQTGRKLSGLLRGGIQRLALWLPGGSGHLGNI
jgi:hypothetical protein